MVQAIITSVCLLSLFYFVNSATVNSSTYALNVLYNSTNGARWYYSLPGQPWTFDGSPDPCGDSWSGVICENCNTSSATPCNVTGLTLDFFGLLGPLPVELCNATELSVLSVSYNTLLQDIPACIFDLPLTYLNMLFNSLSGEIPQLGLDSKLVYLDISQNQFKSPIPSSLGNLADSLTYLALNSNSFYGSIPAEIGCLTLLTSLNFGSNRLNGTMPATLFRMPELSSINLDYNAFSGEIPPAIANSTKLTYLGLSNNDFSGPLPVEVGCLVALRTFSCSSNSLEGSIPSSLGNLAMVTSLDIGVNCFINSLPNSVGNMSSLVLLTAKSNSLTGSLPVSLGCLTKLKSMQLSRNSFNGSIPASFGSLAVMSALTLSYNNIGGEFPVGFSDLGKLRKLAIDHNSFSSTIPPEFGSLSRLTALQASDNFLFGSIPGSFASLSGLKVLDVSNNRLTGQLSDYVAMNLVSMTSLTITGNDFQGTIPSGICSMSRLYTVDVSDNQFTQNIPECFFELNVLTYVMMNGNNFYGPIQDFISHQLVVLDLRYNYFSGSLPSSVLSANLLTVLALASNQFTGELVGIGSSPRLQAIELDSNAFSGPFPSSLSTMTALVVLDLSDNFLTGTITENLGNDNTLKLFQFFVSDNLLTGTIPSSIGSFTNLELIKLSSNMLTGTLPTSLVLLTSCVAYIVNSNRLSGTLSEFFDAASNESFPQLTGLDLSDNNFEGTLPSRLFDIPTLEIVSMSKNCFDGKFPDNICAPVGLLVLYLDGLAAGRSCRKFLSAGVFDSPNVYTADYFHDSLPPCLFDNTLPSLVTAHIGANGIRSTLPELSPNSNLSTVDLSYNRLYSTIPLSFQRATNLVVLDLSYNSLTGTIENMNNIFIPHADNSSSLAPSLKLLVNRLSGYIPQMYEDAPDIDVLTSNLFSCSAEYSVPKYDPVAGRYVCGSDNLNAATGFAVCLIVGLFCILVFRMGVKSRTAEKAAKEGEEDDMGPRLSLAGGVFESVTIDKIAFTPRSSQVPSPVGALPISQPGGGKFRPQLRRASSVASFVTSSGEHAVNLAHLTYTFIFERKGLVVPHDNRSETEIRQLWFQSSSFFIICSYLQTLCVYIAFLAVFVYMPVYIIFKRVNHYNEADDYSTHTYQYSWLVSSAYLEGYPPAITLLIMWILLLVFVIVFVRVVRMKVNDKDIESKEEKGDADNTSFARVLFIRMYQLLINCALVLMVNTMYIYAELYYSKTLQLLGLVLVTAFKLGWNSIGLKLLIDFEIRPHRVWQWLTDNKNFVWDDGYRLTRRGGVLLQYTTTVFNGVLAPCAAVAITNPQCFLNVLFAPTPIVSSYQYEECTSFTITQDHQILCSEYGLGQPVTTSFPPPFIYSFQCSSALLTNYVPVFMIQYAMAGVVFPIGRYALAWYCKIITIDAESKQLCASGADIFETPSVLKNMFHKAIPTCLWPLQFALKYKRFVFESNSREYFQARTILFSIVGGYVVLLTFGVAYPPLALVIASAMVSLTAMWQIIIQRHVDEVKFLSDEDLVLFCGKLEMDCNEVWKSFIRSYALLICSCSFFYGLYFVDVTPNYSGIAIVAVAIPTSWLLIKNLVKSADKTAYYRWSNNIMYIFRKIIKMALGQSYNNTNSPGATTGPHEGNSNSNPRNNSVEEGISMYEVSSNPIRADVVENSLPVSAGSQDSIAPIDMNKAESPSPCTGLEQETDYVDVAHKKPFVFE